MKKKRKTPEGKPLWQVLRDAEDKAVGLCFISACSGGIFKEVPKKHKKPFDNTPEKSE